MSNRSPLRLLSIGAHPADVFDQSGGTMAHHVARGDWVGCVVLTHGARIHDKVISDEMFRRDRIPEAEELTKLMGERGDLKADETRDACAIIGVKDVYFLGADDAVLQVTDANVRQVARLLRELRPDIVLTHFPREGGTVYGNPHPVAGEIVMRAIVLAAGVDPGDTNPPHRVGQIFYYGIGAGNVRIHLWSAEGSYYNDVFVDITDVAHLKVKCLDAMASQGYGGAYARKRIEASDGAFGNAARTAYAEAFIRAKSELHYYLPYTEQDLETTRMSDHEMLDRMGRRLNLETLEPLKPR